MERPILTKEQIKFWLCKHRPIDVADTEQKQRLIDIYLLSVHVYDDKMLICLNYTDGEICVTNEEIQAAMGKKENSGNHKDCPDCPISEPGDYYAVWLCGESTAELLNLSSVTRYRKT
jgi:hypothetical protein